MTEKRSESTPKAQDRGPTELPTPGLVPRAPLSLPPVTPPADDAPISAQSVSASANPEPHLKFAEETHQYIREYIRSADQKAAFFFAGATALLAFLYKLGASARWLRPVSRWTALDGVALIAMIALAVSALLAMHVTIPRTPGSKRGYLFWEAIAEFESGRQYADELATLSTAALFQVKAEHCYDLARVCRRKYAHLRTALWIGAAGLAASMLVFLFG